MLVSMLLLLTSCPMTTDPIREVTGNVNNLCEFVSLCQQVSQDNVNTNPWYLRALLHDMQVIDPCILSVISTLNTTSAAKPRVGSEKLYTHC